MIKELSNKVTKKIKLMFRKINIDMQIITIISMFVIYLQIILIEPTYVINSYNEITQKIVEDRNVMFKLVGGGAQFNTFFYSDMFIFLNYFLLPFIINTSIKIKILVLMLLFFVIDYCYLLILIILNFLYLVSWFVLNLFVTAIGNYILDLAYNLSFIFFNNQTLENLFLIFFYINTLFSLVISLLIYWYTVLLFIGKTVFFLKFKSVLLFCFLLISKHFYEIVPLLSYFLNLFFVNSFFGFKLFLVFAYNALFLSFKFQVLGIIELLLQVDSIKVFFISANQTIFSLFYYLAFFSLNFLTRINLIEIPSIDLSLNISVRPLFSFFYFYVCLLKSKAIAFLWWFWPSQIVFNFKLWWFLKVQDPMAFYLYWNVYVPVAPIFYHDFHIISSIKAFQTDPIGRLFYLNWELIKGDFLRKWAFITYEFQTKRPRQYFKNMINPAKRIMRSAHLLSQHRQSDYSVFRGDIVAFRWPKTTKDVYSSDVLLDYKRMLIKRGRKRKPYQVVWPQNRAAFLHDAFYYFRFGVLNGFILAIRIFFNMIYTIFFYGIKEYIGLIGSLLVRLFSTFNIFYILNYYFSFNNFMDIIVYKIYSLPSILWEIISKHYFYFFDVRDWANYYFGVILKDIQLFLQEQFLNREILIYEFFNLITSYTLYRNFFDNLCIYGMELFKFISTIILYLLNLLNYNYSILILNNSAIVLNFLYEFLYCMGIIEIYQFFVFKIYPDFFNIFSPKIERVFQLFIIYQPYLLNLALNALYALGNSLNNFLIYFSLIFLLYFESSVGYPIFDFFYNFLNVFNLLDWLIIFEQICIFIYLFLVFIIQGLFVILDLFVNNRLNCINKDFFFILDNIKIIDNLFLFRDGSKLYAVFDYLNIFFLFFLNSLKFLLQFILLISDFIFQLKFVQFSFFIFFVICFILYFQIGFWYSIQLSVFYPNLKRFLIFNEIKQSIFKNSLLLSTDQKEKFVDKLLDKMEIERVVEQLYERDVISPRTDLVFMDDYQISLIRKNFYEKFYLDGHNHFRSRIWRTWGFYIHNLGIKNFENSPSINFHASYSFYEKNIYMFFYKSNSHFYNYLDYLKHLRFTLNRLNYLIFRHDELRLFKIQSLIQLKGSFDRELKEYRFRKLPFYYYYAEVMRRGIDYIGDYRFKFSTKPARIFGFFNYLKYWRLRFEVKTMLQSGWFMCMYSLNLFILFTKKFVYFFFIVVYFFFVFNLFLWYNVFALGFCKLFFKKK
jgi:hypothetical protein